MLFERAPDAVVTFDDERRYTEANPAACELFGVPRAVLLRRRIDDFADPNAEPTVDAAWAAFRSTGHQRGEFRLRRRDGTVRITEFSARANVLPGHHLAILRDVTERKARDEQTQASRDGLRRLIEAVPALIIGFDTSWRIVAFNRACETMTGWRRAQVIGRDLLTLLVPPAWHAVVVNRWGARPDKDVAVACQNPWLTKSGAQILVEWRRFRVRSGVGETVLYGIGHPVRTLDGVRGHGRTNAHRAQPAKLSTRESDVLGRVAAGFTSRQIAPVLGVSVKSVETYRARITRKLGLRTRADLVRFALDVGLVPRA